MTPMTVATYLYYKRYEAYMRRRKLCEKTEELADVKCEMCGTNIHRYIGPIDGILCANCIAIQSPACTRIEPLVITRSSIRED